MKYFNSEWYEKKYKPYYEFMEENYEYYPEWFRNYDVAEKKCFLFRNASINKPEVEDTNISIEMIGIDYMVFKGYKLIFENVQDYHFPDDIDKAAYDILAEELYCDKNGMELRFLLYYKGKIYDGFFIKCKRIGIIFEKNPIENKLLFRLLKDELKRRKKCNEIFY